MLEHATPEAAAFLEQLERARRRLADMKICTKVL